MLHQQSHLNAPCSTRAYFRRRSSSNPTLPPSSTKSFRWQKQRSSRTDLPSANIRMVSANALTKARWELQTREFKSQLSGWSTARNQNFKNGQHPVGCHDWWSTGSNSRIAWWTVAFYCTRELNAMPLMLFPPTASNSYKHDETPSTKSFSRTRPRHRHLVHCVLRFHLHEAWETLLQLRLHRILH